MKFWIIVCLSIYLAMGISAQAPLDAFFEVDNTRPRIGQPITVVLIIRYIEGIQVLQRPQLPIESGIFEVLHKGIPSIETIDGRIVERHPFTIVAWQIGDHTLSSTQILYRITNSPNIQIYEIPQVFFSIPSVLQDNDQTLRPYGAPLQLPYLPIWAFTLGISVVIGCIVILTLLWADYRRKHPKPVYVPHPYRVFIQRLEEHPTTYDEINHILRDYLESQFDIPAQKMTSQEILHKLYSQGFLQNCHLQGISDILEHLTIGRFSYYDNQNNKDILQIVYRWAKSLPNSLLDKTR